MKKLITLTLVILLALSTIQFAAAEGTEVSYGKDYTLVTAASEGYPDDGIKLTDGIFGTIPDGATNYYSSGAYVGFNQSAVDENGNFVIILDLGKVYDDLSEFTIGFLNETSVGIYAPKSVTFAISDTEDGSYTDVGTLNTEKSTADGISETHSATFTAETASSGRYVRVTVTHLGEYTDDAGETKSAGWTFIDEISVYSSSNANDESDTSSGVESGTESDPSIDESGETSPESSESSSPVVPGDNRTNALVFILLAISSLGMAGALFAGRKKKGY